MLGKMRGVARMAAFAAETESEEAAVQGLANLGSPHSTDNGRVTEQDTDRDPYDGGDASGGTAGTAGAGEGARSGRGCEYGRGGAPGGSLQDRKRRRVAEQHNKSEQRRRRKINTKLDELQSMVPFSRSREKAAILLDVIEYIKSVQAQLHIMSAITACDYAAYRPSPPHTPHDPYFPTGLGYPCLGGISPTSIVPPMAYHGFPMSSSEALPYGFIPGGPEGSMGLQPGSSGSGGEGEGKRGRREGAEVAAGEGGGGWSFSSGESSAALGAAGDNTASSYEPVMY